MATTAPDATPAVTETTVWHMLSRDDAVQELQVEPERGLSSQEAAERLAKRFWSGPLTMVLPRAELIPGVVSAYLPTVGVRVPHGEIARGLIECLDRPVAAPSANRSAVSSCARSSRANR